MLVPVLEQPLHVALGVGLPLPLLLLLEGGRQLLDLLDALLDGVLATPPLLEELDGDHVLLVNAVPVVRIVLPSSANHSLRWGARSEG